MGRRTRTAEQGPISVGFEDFRRSAAKRGATYGGESSLGAAADYLKIVLIRAFFKIIRQRKVGAVISRGGADFKEGVLHKEKIRKKGERVRSCSRG